MVKAFKQLIVTSIITTTSIILSFCGLHLYIQYTALDLWPILTPEKVLIAIYTGLTSGEMVGVFVLFITCKVVVTQGINLLISRHL